MLLFSQLRNEVKSLLNLNNNLLATSLVFIYNNFTHKIITFFLLLPYTFFMLIIPEKLIEEESKVPKTLRPNLKV